MGERNTFFDSLREVSLLVTCSTCGSGANSFAEDGPYKQRHYCPIHLGSFLVRERLGYEMIPSGLATSAKTSAARNNCSRLCVALTMARSRALPSATVGNPTAGAKTPASNSFFENSNALPASPT